MRVNNTIMAFGYITQRKSEKEGELLLLENKRSTSSENCNVGYILISMQLI